MSDNSFASSAEFAELSAEYEMGGELGRGGNAVVYRATDRGLGRDVAIKVVHPRPLSPDDDAVARLAREARTIAQLQHPNIVAVYAVRRMTNGGLALIMQLAPGRTLKQVVLQDGPVSPDRCQRVLREVASALAYAHSRGVIHRDVKPENIFLDEHSEQVLLADFGIARSLEQDTGTLTGTAIGTPFYMSPEQIDGVAIDGRSDLYSLGLVAWELLTGTRPWDGESLYNVIYKQKHEELPPIEALRKGVPPRLQYVIERMLQKNPSARWAGAEGLLSQLSHSVLPGDYGRWQNALRKRVERYQATERERAQAAQAAQAQAQPHEGGGLFASTIRFVRGGLGGKPNDPSSQLANTMIVPLGQEPPLGHPLSIGATPPAPAPAVLAEPTWSESSGFLTRGRVLAGAGLLTAVAVAGALFIPRAERPTFARSSLPDATPSAPPSTNVTSATGGERAPVLPTAAASSPSASTPVVAPTPNAPAVLALGARHTCVVEASGVVLCWGANDRGQLGDGTAARQMSPVRVSADLLFGAVASGGSHSCAVTRLGDAYCWGSDTRGQLGDATTVRRNAPVRVAGPGVYRAITAGDAYTCALTIEGAVHCWGANDRGQLGDGTTRSRNVPAAIDAPVGQRFVEVVAGGAHACARTDRGAAYCWGANDRGQLGVSGSDRRSPVAVGDRAQFVSITAGNAHSCAVTTDGVVKCWGGNARGQLGTSTRANASSPQPVRLAATATRVSAGAQHTCALLTTGEAFCWGANGGGQLGAANAGDAALPARVATTEHFVAIAGGGDHTCAITTAGAPLCWGGNGDGEVGDASRTTRRAPAAVAFDTVASRTR